jgi:predicted transcriptional regulator
MAKATLAKKREAYLLRKQGYSVLEIAKEMNLSERMVYRYLDEYELHQLRQWRDQFNDALKTADKDQPLSVFLKILKAQAKKDSESE